MEKVKSFLILIVLSLAIPFLSSCSNDDEDGSIRSDGTNLVGTWAEISTHSNGEQIAYYVYIIKADCSIVVLGFHQYNYDEGYLIDPYKTQQELEKHIEERAADNTYHCTFSNNTFYWEGDAMAKITVIDSETVKMESVHLGNATLKKIKRMVGKADLDFLGFYSYSESLVGKWIGVDSETNADGTVNAHWLFEVDEYGTVSARQVEGTFEKDEFDSNKGVILSPLSQEELDNKLKTEATVYKYCQRKDYGLFCGEELFATLKAGGLNEFQLDSKKWGSLKLIKEPDNLRFISTQDFNFNFTPSTGGNPVSLVGSWVFIDDDINMKGLSDKRLLTLDSNGTICLYTIYGTYDNHTFKTPSYQFGPFEEYDYCQRKGNDLYCNGNKILTAQCINSDKFNIVWQYYYSYTIERVNNIIWEYDYSKRGYTSDEPFTVEEAIAKCREIGSTESENNFYIKGIISSISEVSLSYGNATFNISDNGDDNSVLTAYHANAIGGNRFHSENEIKVGDVVVLCGKLVNYRGYTPELLQGYIYSLSSGNNTIDFGTHGDGTTR